MYSFHRRVKNTYNLRCNDWHCKGAADYDIEAGKIIINKPCTKNYENHSYIKEELIIKKIRAKGITKEDLIDNIENQEIYFKYLYVEHPNLTYYDICNYLNENYQLGIINYSWTLFNKHKINIQYQKKLITLREERLDTILYDSEKLLKLKLIYPDEKDNKLEKTIRIFGTKNSLELLSDKKVAPYFIDGTYKYVPHSLDSVNVLLILIAYNADFKQFELALAATFNKED
jgi:hypothetical protein